MTWAKVRVGFPGGQRPLWSDAELQISVGLWWRVPKLGQGRNAQVSLNNWGKRHAACSKQGTPAEGPQTHLSGLSNLQKLNEAKSY
jgi:hypothetical protein